MSEKYVQNPWWETLDRQMADIADEMKIQGHNYANFGRRIDQAMHAAARARQSEQESKNV